MDRAKKAMAWALEWCAPGGAMRPGRTRSRLITETEMIWHLLPLMGMALFVGIVFCWRPWLQFRRHGTWGIVLFRSRSQGLRDASVLVAFTLLLGQAIVAASSPQSLSVPDVDQPAREIWQAGGAVVLFGGLGLLVAAQLQLAVLRKTGLHEYVRVRRRGWPPR